MLGFLQRESDPRFNLQVKRPLYLSLVRFLPGYASGVWTPLSARDLRSVEGIQRRATKLIHAVMQKIPPPHPLVSIHQLQTLPI